MNSRELLFYRMALLKDVLIRCVHFPITDTVLTSLKREASLGEVDRANHYAVELGMLADRIDTTELDAVY